MGLQNEENGLPAWLDRIEGTRTEDYLRIYKSTEWCSDVNETYQNIVDTLYSIMHAGEVHLHILDPEGNVFSRKASHRGAERGLVSTDPLVKVGVGRSRDLLSNQKPQILDHAFPDPRDELPYDAERYSVCIPLTTIEGVLGMCTITYFERQDWNDDDMDHFSIIGFIVGSAISRLRTTERVVELAVIDERKRLGSELHDNVVQFLHAVSLNAASVVASYENEDFDSMIRNLERLEANCKKTVKVFRDEMLSLRAPLAGERVTGLISSIEEVLKSYENNWGIKTSLNVETTNVPLYTSPASAIQLMRILNETLSNTLRHSEATEVKVSIYEDNAHLVLTVEDNGKGFDVESVPDTNHWGMKIMQERADLIMGKLIVKSDDGGTVITVDVPRHG